MVHYLNLPANVFVIVGAEEFAFWDGLAGVGVSGGLLSTKIGGTKLTLTELPSQSVEVSKVLGPVGEDPNGL